MGRQQQQPTDQVDVNPISGCHFSPSLLLKYASATDLHTLLNAREMRLFREANPFRRRQEWDSPVNLMKKAVKRTIIKPLAASLLLRWLLSISLPFLFSSLVLASILFESLSLLLENF